MDVDVSALVVERRAWGGTGVAYVSWSQRMLSLLSQCSHEPAPINFQQQERLCQEALMEDLAQRIDEPSPLSTPSGGPDEQRA